MCCVNLHLHLHLQGAQLAPVSSPPAMSMVYRAGLAWYAEGS